MKRLVLALPVLALLFATGAQAAPLYDNIGQPDVGSDPIAPNLSGPLADSFMTLATAFAFGDLKLKLATSNENDGGSIIVKLLSDNSMSPGSQLAILGSVADGLLSANPTVVDLSFSAIPLAANTRYWIQLSTIASAGGEWAFSA